VCLILNTKPFAQIEGRVESRSTQVSSDRLKLTEPTWVELNQAESPRPLARAGSTWENSTHFVGPADSTQPSA